MTYTLDFNPFTLPSVGATEIVFFLLVVVVLLLASHLLEDEVMEEDRLVNWIVRLSACTSILLLALIYLGVKVARAYWGF